MGWLWRAEGGCEKRGKGVWGRGESDALEGRLGDAGGTVWGRKEGKRCGGSK